MHSSYHLLVWCAVVLCLKRSLLPSKSRVIYFHRHVHRSYSNWLNLSMVAKGFVFRCELNLPESMSEPSGENATQLRKCPCPDMEPRALPVVPSQALIVLSQEPVISRLGWDGENARVHTLSLCPIRVCFRVPSVVSHIFIVLSWLQLASSLESAENSQHYEIVKRGAFVSSFRVDEPNELSAVYICYFGVST